MLILNFSHPLSSQQQAQIEALTKTIITEIRTIPVRIDQHEPLEPQITAIIEAVGLSSAEWQTYPFLINPPGHVPATLVLLAELHGRIGHFPTVLRLCPVYQRKGTFEVVEILNLQNIREAARRQR